MFQYSNKFSEIDDFPSLIEVPNFHDDTFALQVIIESLTFV